MSVEVSVDFADADPNGLALLLGELVRANLARFPERRALLASAAVGFDVPDAEVAATLLLDPTAIRVANGLAADPLDVLVRAEAAALLDLSGVPLRFGLPDPATGPGRAVLRKLLSGDIGVRGALRNPGALRRVTQLLTVT